MSDVSIRTVDPRRDASWTAMLDLPDASIFHTPTWMDVVHATYGLDVRATLLERDEQPQAAVAWTEADDLLGHRRTTLVCADFCDILAGTAEDASALADAVLAEAPQWDLRSRARNVPELEAPVRNRTEYVLQTVDLAPSEAELWTGMSSMARRGVRKSGREGVTVRAAATGRDLRDWYLLHLRVRRDKHHLLAQPYAFFEHLWDRFIAAGNGFLLLATYEDRVIGGDLFLTWRDRCYYKFNASDTTLLHLRPNNVLLWYGMLEAKERGCRVLDLGRSPRTNVGLQAFKEGFGASDEALVSLTYGPQLDESARCREQEARELLRSMTQLFVRNGVPEAVTEQAGARLYRYFV